LAFQIGEHRAAHLLLVDPSGLGGLPGDDLLWLEPESNLLLCVLNAVRAVADVPSDIDSVITADRAWGGSQWVGGAEKSWYKLDMWCCGALGKGGWGHTAAGLDGIAALPDHGADWAGVHVYVVSVDVVTESIGIAVQATRPEKNGLEERSSSAKSRRQHERQQERRSEHTVSLEMGLARSGQLNGGELVAG